QWELYLNVYWKGPLISQLIGFPVGEIRSIASRAPPDDIEARMLMAVAHSGYINFLVSSGCIGLGLFLTGLIVPLSRSFHLMLRFRNFDSTDRYFRLAIALIVAIAIYAYAYPINELGLLLAVALGIIGKVSKELAQLPPKVLPKVGAAA